MGMTTTTHFRFEFHGIPAKPSFGTDYATTIDFNNSVGGFKEAMGLIRQNTDGVLTKLMSHYGENLKECFVTVVKVTRESGVLEQSDTIRRQRQETTEYWLARSASLQGLVNW